MRLTPKAPEIPDEGFNEDNDLFGYREFGERLTRLVENVQGPLVIALDGPWGSGKSVFVRQWVGLLRKSGARAVVFDAFGNDHFEDAFLALSAEIHAAAKERLGDQEPVKEFLRQAKRTGTALVPMLSRIAIRVGTAGVLSLEDLRDSDKVLKAIQETADVVEGVVAERLETARDERDALEDFRNTLSALARKLGGNDESESKFPFVFIIDELDRCRPPFALSVIERVKHLFSVPGVCFVFVTNMDQLEAAVLGTYGSATNARTYLQKFYSLRVELPEAKVPQGREALYISHLWESLGIRFSQQVVDRTESDQRRLQRLATDHELSLRALERVATNLLLASASLGPRDRIFSSDITIDLCVLREKYPETFQKARTGGLGSKDVRNRLWTGADDEDRLVAPWERLEKLTSERELRDGEILRHMVNLIEALAIREK